MRSQYYQKMAGHICLKVAAAQEGLAEGVPSQEQVSVSGGHKIPTRTTGVDEDSHRIKTIGHGLTRNCWIYGCLCPWDRMCSERSKSVCACSVPGLMDKRGKGVFQQASILS